jgi:hypothetical protein
LRSLRAISTCRSAQWQQKNSLMPRAATTKYHRDGCNADYAKYPHMGRMRPPLRFRLCVEPPLFEAGPAAARARFRRPRDFGTQRRTLGVDVGFGFDENGPPMTRIARTARIQKPQSDVIAHLQEFFSQKPKLQVKALGPSTAGVEVQYSLLYDWTRVAPPSSGVAFAWRPAWRGFPSFGATLTVRPAGQETELVLEGSYEPPGGAVGRVFDRIVGQKLAARTMDALLDQLAHNA